MLFFGVCVLEVAGGERDFAGFSFGQREILFFSPPPRNKNDRFWHVIAPSASTPGCIEDEFDSLLLRVFLFFFFLPPPSVSTFSLSFYMT